ncbi:hypothetical protein D3C76_1614600 [compost metagenome]
MIWRQLQCREQVFFGRKDRLRFVLGGESVTNLVKIVGFRLFLKHLVPIVSKHMYRLLSPDECSFVQPNYWALPSESRMSCNS